MTCIVAVVRGSTTVLAADSQITSAWTRYPAAEAKVAAKDRLLLGVTGRVRISNVVVDHWTPPVHHSDVSPRDWVVKELVPSLRETLKEHACVRVENEVEEIGPSDNGSSILVALRGSIFQVSSDFAVLPVKMPYDAVGSGREYALGVLGYLHGAENLADLDPVGAALAALRAASTFDLGCGPPFHVLRDDDGTVVGPEEHT